MKELKAKLLRKLGRNAATSAKMKRPVDATAEPDPGPPPEAIFDRATGPFGSPRYRLGPGARIEGS